MKCAADEMDEIMADLDRLTACHPDFSLRNWIETARGFGNDDAAKDYYERNARTLISVWGDSYHLTDYASRTWAGMVSTYYAPRWRMFTDRVTECAAAGRPFDQQAFDKDIRDFECTWLKPSHTLTYPEAGDAVIVARELAAKYKERLDARP